MQGSTRASEDVFPSTIRPPVPRTDSDEDQLIPDDRPPSKMSRMGSKHLAVGIGTIFFICVTGFILSFQYPANRQKLLQYFSHGNSNFPASIGLLSTRNFVDEELLIAAEYILNSHRKSQDPKDVQLRVAYTDPTASSISKTFDSLWNEGIRVFLVGGDDVMTTALCRHLEKSGKPARVFSPAAFRPSGDCPHLVSLYPSHGALLVAEISRITENGLTRVIPLVVREEMGLVSDLMDMGAAQGLKIEAPFLIQSRNSSTSKLQQILHKYPRAAVWLSLGQDLPQLLLKIGNILKGHLVIVHAHPIDLSKLLRNPEARRIAEVNAICTSEWAGSSEVNSVVRRRLLASLQLKDPLIGALAYDTVSLALSEAIRHSRDETRVSMPEAKITTSDGNLSDIVSGFIVWKRLVLEQLIGKQVLQDSPWLLEGFLSVRNMGGKQWSVIHKSHFPVHIVKKEELKALAKKGKCTGDLWVKATAYDPLSHRPTTASWELSTVPEVMLLPNGSPNGFTLQTWCKNLQETQVLEFGCQGATSHNESLICLTVLEGPQKRRTIRSTIRKYGYPIRRKKYPNRRQDQAGAVDEILKKKEIKSLIPQIGGCLGATGGCALCFFYILLNDVAISPGVCFGACSVAVGGSCSTLLSRGVQYHLDHSVICTELFTQRRISLTSYMADAKYGSRLSTTNPRALHGYRTLAGPLVAIMQVSPAISSVVEAVAQPWLRHMEHEEGLRPNDDAIGRLMTCVGLPVCCVVATVLDHIDTIAFVTLVALLRKART
ncbi:uncharacterized protein [Palaemon carinicauda]|uniref:uncharacterized protein n=1 Tax=Palaemon carinicauda TaxID=392227 RepID=UPI0035B692F0